MSRKVMNPVMAEIRDSDDYDPWGMAMTWLFAIAEVAYVEYDHIMPDFRPSPMTDGRDTIDDDDYEAQALLEAIDAREITLSDLEYAFTIMDRYRAWCVLAGRDY